MTTSDSPKPLVRHGWLRALLYILTFLLFAFLVLAGFIFGLHKGSADIAGLQSIMEGEAMKYITGIFFLMTILITWAFRRWVDRKTFLSVGLNLSGYTRDAIAGAGLAIFIMGAGSLILKWTGHLKWMDIIFDPKALFLALGTVVLVAFYEELIFRGYILNNLLDSFPKWLALSISAILFSLFHGTFVGFFSLANGLVFGLILGLNYIYTRNLWFSICFHIVWKFMEGPILGYSGNELFQSLLQPELTGHENITGGASGFGGSAILMAVSLISGLVLFLLLQKKLSPQSQPVPGRI